MRKIWIGIFSVLTCAVMTVSADGFSESDNLIAGKDFPFPPDESDLPENVPSDDSDGTAAPQQPSYKKGSSPQGKTQSNKSEKAVYPEVNSKKPKAGKDIFPPDAE